LVRWFFSTILKL